MNAKRIITLVLLVFVSISIVYLIVQSAGFTSRADTTDPATAADPPLRVEAYYFHATKRCPTCLEIEALADEAVTTAFARELQDGRLSWDIVNFESPGHEHYVDDYELIYSSLILVEYRDGEQTRWKNLDKVWDLVWEREAFIEYVTREIRSFLTGTGESDSIPELSL